MNLYIFGVDLGGTTAKIGLFTDKGELLEKWEIPTRTENQGENILPDIAASLKEKMAQRRITDDDIIGIGMGVPGSVKKDRYVAPCVNLNHWGGDVGGQMKVLTGITTKVLNDANAATLGEMSSGAGKGHKDVALFTLGTGIGGGVVIDGKLLTGVHGSGGELGHMKVSEPDGDICGCGKSGCVERFASATGVVNRAKMLLADPSIQSKMRAFEPLTCKNVIDCAKEGDEPAMQIVDLMTKKLAKAASIVTCVCDPEMIILGGGVSRAGSILTEKVSNYYQDYCFPTTTGTQFALATLGNDAGIFGAMQMILGDD